MRKQLLDFLHRLEFLRQRLHTLAGETAEPDQLIRLESSLVATRSALSALHDLRNELESLQVFGEIQP